jgi:hypothetical protein
LWKVASTVLPHWLLRIICVRVASVGGFSATL